MATKLKIDLSQGVLEVEGSETFVKAIYSDFKAHFTGEESSEDLFRRKQSRTPKSTRTQTRSKSTTRAKSTRAPAKSTSDTSQTDDAETSAPEKPRSKRPPYKYLDDLDLTSTNGRPSLAEYMDTKLPITNEERNLVFLYYLQFMLKLGQITIDHIYTCYKAVKIRAPLSMENSLESTAKQRRWIKANKNGTFKVTPAGKLYVEKQLPKKIKG